jgi:hypothetical protein
MTLVNRGTARPSTGLTHCRGLSSAAWAQQTADAHPRDGSLPVGWTLNMLFRNRLWRFHG